MNEQKSGLGQLKTRHSSPPQPPASRHRVGHQAGLHPEDQPYITGDDLQEELLEEDEVYYMSATANPRSAIRYTTIDGAPVITHGGRQFVIHDVPLRRSSLQPAQAPPRHQDYEEAPAPWRGTRRIVRFHFLVYTGLAMLLMFVGFVVLNALGTWWQTTQDDWRYGRPRTYQTNAAVGHNSDSQAHPSHFIALNLNGRIEIIELPAGDATKAIIYQGPALLGDTPTLIPVTLEFKDTTGSGRQNMIVHAQNESIIYLNNGVKFVSPQ